MVVAHDLHTSRHLALVVAINATFFERPKLEVLRGIRVQLKKILEPFSIQVHSAHIMFIFPSFLVDD